MISSTGLAAAWAPRILRLGLANQAEDRLAGTIARGAVLGFDHVLLAAPFHRAFGDRADLIADLDRLHASLGGHPARPWLRAAVRAARGAGLHLLLDLVLDRVAADSPLAASGPFLAPPPGTALDPRFPARLDVAAAALDDPGQVEALAAFWTPILRGWQSDGVAGVRVLDIFRLPQAASLLRRLHAACPGLRLLAWTPGTKWADLQALHGSGVNAVASSLGWWRWQGDWVWQEWELLRRIAPVITSCGPALLGDAPAERRAVLLGGLLGDGWLLDLDHAEACADSVELVNRLRPPGAAPSAPTLLSGPDGPVLALLRPGPGRPWLVVANGDDSHRRAVPAAQLLPGSGATLFRPGDDGAALTAGGQLVLEPAGVRLLRAAPAPPAPTPTPLAPPDAQAPRLAIEAVSPAVDDGRFAVRRLAGEDVAVEADILCDGHDQLAAQMAWRAPGGAWQETAMQPLGNDRWTARFALVGLGVHEFAVLAWRDHYASFRDELAKKHAAGVETHLELREGRALLAEFGAIALLARFDAADADDQRALLLDDATQAWMRAQDPRAGAIRSTSYPVRAERAAAAFASWYEIFPRSMSDDPHRHGNFADVIRHLPRIRDMGFDVLYFPPIHPIGRVARKGRNNSLQAGPDDPGSPYAIGSTEGGHDAIHPQLGTLADFRRLREEAAGHGLELALDFAIQCAPDHPWLAEHKGWFSWRPDGSLRTAENPPKKYEDIVNVDFYAPDAVPDLWIALADIVLLWAAEGVRLFRVDNPHTKPFPFWEWLIAQVQARYPDTVFLAEAFTRPKIMYRLAKLGFSQSYTYFTWRDDAASLRTYFTELTETPQCDFFRPHLFVNTPDINPPFLQTSGRPGFMIRAALAATLSGLWGVYNGFELCEATPVPGREEYADSEKYQIRAWDWDRPGNIVPVITRLNRIRRSNPALRTHLGLTFIDVSNNALLVYEKATPGRDNVLIVAISTDPLQPQSGAFELPLWRWHLPDDASLLAEDLVDDSSFTWHGKYQTVALDPDRPYRIWRVRPA